MDSKEDEPRSFFFVSEDATTNPDKLLVLIHGSGVVRAGQWARRYCSLKNAFVSPFVPATNKAQQFCCALQLTKLFCLSICSFCFGFTRTVAPKVSLRGYPVLVKEGSAVSVIRMGLPVQLGSLCCSLGDSGLDVCNLANQMEGLLAIGHKTFEKRGSMREDESNLTGILTNPHYPRYMSIRTSLRAGVLCLCLLSRISPNCCDCDLLFRLIINDCLDSGTQLPFIKKAIEKGYGVMVLNTNLNKEERDGQIIPIRVRQTRAFARLFLVKTQFVFWRFMSLSTDLFVLRVWRLF